MGEITEADVVAVVSRADALIAREVVRTKASRSELRSALAVAKGAADVTSCSALPPRMQRLVDLLSVALPERGQGRSAGSEASVREASRAA